MLLRTVASFHPFQFLRTRSRRCSRTRNSSTRNIHSNIRINQATLHNIHQPQEIAMMCNLLKRQIGILGDLARTPRTMHLPLVVLSHFLDILVAILLKILSNNPDMLHQELQICCRILSLTNKAQPTHMDQDLNPNCTAIPLISSDRDKIQHLGEKWLPPRKCTLIQTIHCHTTHSQLLVSLRIGRVDLCTLAHPCGNKSKQCFRNCVLKPLPPFLCFVVGIGTCSTFLCLY